MNGCTVQYTKMGALSTGTAFVSHMILSLWIMAKALLAKEVRWCRSWYSIKNGKLKSVARRGLPAFDIKESYDRYIRMGRCWSEEEIAERKEAKV